MTPDRVGPRAARLVTGGLGDLALKPGEIELLVGESQRVTTTAEHQAVSQDVIDTPEGGGFDAIQCEGSKRWR